MGIILVLCFSESNALPWVLAREFQVNVAIQKLTLKASTLNLVKIVYTSVKMQWLRRMWGSLYFVMPEYFQDCFRLYEDGRREVVELVGHDCVPEDFGMKSGETRLINDEKPEEEHE